MREDIAMTKVAIWPVPTERGGISYQAAAGDKRSQGATAGAALDALTAQLPEDDTGTLVVLQSHRPDRFFDVTQQQRVSHLMTRWRSARDLGQALPNDEQLELTALVEAELQASANRTAALVDELGR
jgi:hypothetical protein